MGEVTYSIIGCFNPFEMEGFHCPVCQSNKFVELVVGNHESHEPYGGVWCEECNAQFIVSATCDGIRKLSIRCSTKHVHNQDTMRKEACQFDYGTVVWEHDKEVSWLKLRKRRLN